METGRLETFADGVFAIAATLLIIDVTVPDRSTALGHSVLHAWPEYAAYAVSFVTIGIMWLNHHLCLRQIGAVDRTFMVLNLFLMMCIAFVPFPTKLVALHLRDDGERAAALTYGVTLTLTAVCFAAFWFYAARNNRLIAEDADPMVIKGARVDTMYGLGNLMDATIAAAPRLTQPLFLMYGAHDAVIPRTAFSTTGGRPSPESSRMLCSTSLGSSPGIQRDSTVKSRRSTYCAGDARSAVRSWAVCSPSNVDSRRNSSEPARSVFSSS